MSTIDQMITFVTKRAHSESMCPQFPAKSDSSGIKTYFQPRQAFAVSASQGRCLHCSSNDHYINNCNKFVELNPFSRYETATKNGWCTNCLRDAHQSSKCTSGKCRKCSQQDHTHLHFDKRKILSVDAENAKPNSFSQATSGSVENMHALVSSEALLATAIVDIVNPQGQSKACRIFLDAKSQAHFITESTPQFLKLD